MLAPSMSGSISDQVEPLAVGASRMKPRVRASRSQLHRKAPPLPLPPCIATTSGQARDGVVVLRHIEREGAARAGRAADMHRADLSRNGSSAASSASRALSSRADGSRKNWLTGLRCGVIG